MKNIHFKQILNEIISLAKTAGVKYDGNISQNYIAVTPNCPNWLFLRPKGVNPSYLGNSLSSYDGVILQNKPIGEYAERYLCKPRVNPITLFGRFSQTQNYIGAYQMNAFHTILSKLSLFTPLESLVIGFLSVMGV